MFFRGLYICQFYKIYLWLVPKIEAFIQAQWILLAILAKKTVWHVLYFNFFKTKPSKFTKLWTQAAFLCTSLWLNKEIVNFVLLIRFYYRSCSCWAVSSSRLFLKLASSFSRAVLIRGNELLNKFMIEWMND